MSDNEGEGIPVQQIGDSEFESEPEINTEGDLETGQEIQIDAVVDDITTGNEQVDQEREVVSREVRLQSIEMEIIEKQIAAFLADEDAIGRLQRIGGNEKLKDRVPALLQIYLEAFGAEPHLVPKAPLREQTIFDHHALFRRAILRIRLFPDTVISNAYGVKFNHSKNTEEGLREREEYLQYIGTLFVSLVPLQYKSRDRQRRHKSRRMLVNPTKRKKGALIVSRKVKTLEGERRDVLWYKSLYDVRRADKRMLNAYSGIYTDGEIEGQDEQSTLKALRANIQNMIGFLQRWKFSTPEEKTQAALLIAELEEELRTKINVFKAQARVKLGSAKQIEKGKRVEKRPNPGASSAELVASYNRLRKRTEEIFSIMGNVMQDHEIVEKLIEELEQIFEGLRGKVDQLLLEDYFKPYEEIENPEQFLRENAMSICGIIYNRINEKGILGVVKKLHEHEATPAPFSWWAAAVNSNLEMVRKINLEIVKHDFGKKRLKEEHLTVRKYAIRAHLALRYQKLQQELMRLLDAILQRPLAVKSHLAKERIEKLLKDFNPHAFGEPFKHHEDVKFQVPTFETITGQMDKLIEIIIEWEVEKNKIESDQSVYMKSSRKRPADSRNMSDFETRRNEVMQVFLQKIYNLIKEIDFEEAAKTLNPNNQVFKSEEE